MGFESVLEGRPPGSLCDLLSHGTRLLTKLDQTELVGVDPLESEIGGDHYAPGSIGFREQDEIIVRLFAAILDTTGFKRLVPQQLHQLFDFVHDV